ncbi:hypothetical protein ES332_D01G043800v1 [Gossypium tomentosum]|uniref:Uncharacterized protein n=1 Tax=Gossypium tomentosum TaxID=34277 RepID=A0A5D2M595_GOSTO|nr:hypothetical protein ES332_D01G043800v1 [Gossypium tomentosum]
MSGNGQVPLLAISCYLLKPLMSSLLTKVLLQISLAGKRKAKFYKYWSNAI